MTPESLLSGILRYLIPPVVFLVFIWFGLGWLLPKLWNRLEWVWWRVWLGRTLMGNSIRTLALKDFHLLVREKETDEGAARPLAVVFAIGSRLVEFPRLHRYLRKIKNEKEEYMFKTSIQNLIEGWRSGTPPPVLAEYMKIIQDGADSEGDPRQRLRGRCAVANVKYLLGDLKEGNAMAKENWKYARSQEPEIECEFKWMASYAYFNSTLFLGEFDDAMELMMDHWGPHYARLSVDQQEKLIRMLSGILTLNPVLSIPRHMILAAAFSGSPRFERKFWPSGEEFDHLPSEDRNSELVWLTCWYENAKRMCEGDVISLDFSHAYAGFYLTLLYKAQEHLDRAARQNLSRKAEAAFDSIGENSPLVSRYAKWGFLGIYYLVMGSAEEALKSLRRAAEYSAISGNKFADCIFMCAHAVAAQRVNRYLKPEVDYYLAEASRLAKRLDRVFYSDLCEKASSEVSRSRGNCAKAERLDARSRGGRAGERILSIFRE